MPSGNLRPIRFGHPDLANLGNPIWANLVLVNGNLAKTILANLIFGQSPAPPRTALSPTAQNFALVFPLPPHFSFFLPSFGCLLVEFWWCFAGGLHTTAQELQTCTFEGPSVFRQQMCPSWSPPDLSPRVLTQTDVESFEPQRCPLSYQ